MTTARQTTHPATGRGADLGPQRRTFALDGAQLRSAPNGTGGESLTFTGYASVTNRSYEMNDMAGPYPETVRSGAFAKTLARNPDVPFLVNHDGMTLARTKSGTLQLAEDSTGLLATATLDPRNSTVSDLRVAMERGDVDEMSFAFRILDPDGGWTEDYSARNITEVDLHKGDVSVVNYGASEHTAGATMRGLERFLSGLTPQQADIARRRLARGQAIPADLASYLSRAAALRRGATGRHTRKPSPPMNDETRQAIAWVLRQQQ